jgi:hypothetical protein
MTAAWSRHSAEGETQAYQANTSGGGGCHSVGGRGGGGASRTVTKLKARVGLGIDVLRDASNVLRVGSVTPGYAAFKSGQVTCADVC